jgi:outer membrane protein assembly factor BamE
MHRLAVFRALTGAAAVLALAGCASLQSSDNFLGVVTPYRIEIVQGNVLTQEQVEQVKPGMPKAQVRNLLGSPLLNDMFHADRWDYIFTIKRQGAEPQRRSVVVMFEGDLLKTIDAPALPTEREFVAAISTVKPSGRTPVLELTEEQRKALPAPAPLVPEPALPAGPVREYPPLEAR